MWVVLLRVLDPMGVLEETLGYEFVCTLEVAFVMEHSPYRHASKSEGDSMYHRKYMC